MSKLEHCREVEPEVGAHAEDQGDGDDAQERDVDVDAKPMVE